MLVTHIDELVSQFMGNRSAALPALPAQGDDTANATGNPVLEQIGRKGQAAGWDRFDFGPIFHGAIEVGHFYLFKIH